MNSNPVLMQTKTWRSVFRSRFVYKSNYFTDVFKVVLHKILISVFFFNYIVES